MLNGFNMTRLCLFNFKTGIVTMFENNIFDLTLTIIYNIFITKE